MIYCVEPKDYPAPDQFIEESIYQDQNDFEWRVARIENGFFIRYFGHDYFKENMFSFTLDSGSVIYIKNTNCIFFNCVDFETFYEIREIINNGFTDEIWEVIEGLFKERFECDPRILESEII